MRTILAVLLAISVLFVGITAISESGQQSKDTALNGTDSQSDAWNLTDSTFGGMSEAGSSALVYGGIGAAIIVSLGVLVSAGRSGGR